MELRAVRDLERRYEPRTARKPEPDLLKKGHEYEYIKERRAILRAARREIDEEQQTDKTKQENNHWKTNWNTCKKTSTN